MPNERTKRLTSGPNWRLFSIYIGPWRALPFEVYYKTPTCDSRTHLQFPQTLLGSCRPYFEISFFLINYPRFICWVVVLRSWSACRDRYVFENMFYKAWFRCRHGTYGCQIHREAKQVLDRWNYTIIKLYYILIWKLYDDYNDTMMIASLFFFHDRCE